MTQQGSDDAAGASTAEDWESAVLPTAHAFYEWWGSIALRRRARIEGAYATYATALAARLQRADEIAATVDASLTALGDLRSRHATIAEQMTRIRKSCARLVHERDMLAEYRGALAARLGAFDELDALSRAFATLPSAAVATGGADGADTVLGLLARIDSGLAYMASNPQYVDTMAYTLKLRQLQARAIGHLLEHIQSILARGVAASSAVGAPVSEGHGDSAGTSTSDAAAAAEPPPAALLAVRFRAAVERPLGPLLEELRRRAASASDGGAGAGTGADAPEYVRLLANAEAALCAARQQLVQPVVSARIAALERSSPSVCNLARQACAYVLDVCRSEAQLVLAFFPPAPPSPPASALTSSYRRTAAPPGPPGAPPPSQALTALLEALCHALHDTLRPRFIQISSVEELAELVDVLRHAVATDALARSGSVAAAPPASATPGAARGAAAVGQLAGPAVSRIVADVQERLIFRASAYLREDVFGFQPAPADLDFPAVLVRLAEQQRTAAAAAAAAGTASPVARAAAPPVATVPATPTAATGPNAPPRAAAATRSGAPDAAMDAAWYAPVRRTLSTLGVLYRSLEPPAFSSIGQDALLMCTSAVQSAARRITALSGPLDGHLFSVRHLLTLREQISPFQADFRGAERELDFSHVRDQLARVLAGKLPIFALSRENAMVQMVAASGGVRVAESHVDSKRELERALRGACEAVILAVTKVAAEPLMSFLTKAAAARAAQQRGGGGPPRPLAQHAFASPEKLAAAVRATQQALGTAYPAAVERMRLYLPKAKTQAALLGPIRSNILEAHGQVAALLQSQYTAEQATEVGLMSGGDLTQLLEMEGPGEVEGQIEGAAGDAGPEGQRSDLSAGHTVPSEG